MLKKITKDNVNEIIAKLKAEDTFSCDTETYGLGWLDKAFMLGFGTRDGSCYYIRDTHDGWKELSTKIVEELQDCSPVFANAKYDSHRLIWLTGSFFKKSHDVIVMDKLLYPENASHSLKNIGRRLFSEKEGKEQDEIMRWFELNNDCEKEFWKLPDEIILPYFQQDLILTLKVFDYLNPKIDNFPNLRNLYNTEREILWIMTLAEQKGVLVDREYLEKFKKECEDKAAKLESYLKKAFNTHDEFNFESPVQLADLLYNQLGFPVVKKTWKGAPSVDADAISHIDHPAIPKLQEFQKLQTYLSKFIRPWLEFSAHDGRLHASFNTTGAVSGRFTCDSPNLQQIMKDPKILKALKFEPECVNLHADLSQIELVGAAWYMREPTMLKAIKEGKDLHKDTAAALFNKSSEEVTKDERSIAKGMNFSILYGCGKKRLASFLSQHTKRTVSDKEASRIRASYHEKFPTIKKFTYKVQDTINKRPDRIIRNYFGRRYYIQPQKEYVGVNRLIQGWAADLMKVAMVKIGNLINWEDTYINCQIHDMVSIVCPKEKLEEVRGLVETAMTHFPEFDLPISVKIEVKEESWEK